MRDRWAQFRNRFGTAIRAIGPALLLAVCPVTAASAQDAAVSAPSENEALEHRAQDVVRWLRGEVEAKAIFAPEFLAAIPAETLDQMNAQLNAQLGAIVGVESLEPVSAQQARIALRFERAIGKGTIVIGGPPADLIAGLQLAEFTPLDAETASPAAAAEAIAADLEALPGRTAVWFGPLDGQPIFAHGDPDAQFALGSALKLYVLGALGEAIEAKRLRWDQVVKLGERSFPSGVMQDWPKDTPVTVQTLATLMITISDNTATDTLIRLVGRGRVEAFLRRTGHSDPDRSLPFLTTREAFVLKTLPTGPAYAAADTARRRAMLRDLGGEDLTAAQVVEALAKPRLVERIEWFASMADERKLLSALVALDDPVVFDILAVSPQLSPAQRAGWSYTGFKGGSEPGVLNLTWLLRDPAGRWHMLAASWLDPEAEVDAAALGMIAMRVLALKN